MMRWRIRQVRIVDRDGRLSTLMSEPPVEITLQVASDDVELAERIERGAGIQGVELERIDDPRFAEPIGPRQVAGLAVAFKALLQRAGGRVEITEAELLEAEQLLARVDATPELFTVELVDGDPPDVPRFAAEDEQGAEPLTPADRDEFGHGLGEIDGGDE